MSWPPGTIVVCIEGEVAGEHSTPPYVVEGQYYTIASNDHRALCTGKPLVTLAEFPDDDRWWIGWYTERFRKAESTHDERATLEVLHEAR